MPIEPCAAKQKLVDRGENQPRDLGEASGDVHGKHEPYSALVMLEVRNNDIAFARIPQLHAGLFSCRCQNPLPVHGFQSGVQAAQPEVPEGRELSSEDSIACSLTCSDPVGSAGGRDAVHDNVSHA
eukprot:748417-Hanusia_phi.AAC.5